MGCGKMKIIYEDNHIIVAKKPINMPVQEDSSKDPDLLNNLKKYIKEKYDKKGNVYLGLVHRLDRPVGGIMVFARTSKAASRLSEEIRSNRFLKIYYAVVQGKPLKNDEFIDYIKRISNKSIIDPSGKKSILSYELIDTCDNLSLVKIKLDTGRHHQIRVQFSSHGYPLWGDQLYNKNAKVGEQIALFAESITFKHPVKDEVMTFKIPLPNKYPWSLFRSDLK